MRGFQRPLAPQPLEVHERHPDHRAGDRVDRGQQVRVVAPRYMEAVDDQPGEHRSDLPSGDDRERAIQYVYERYGQLGAAMCANVIT